MAKITEYLNSTDEPMILIDNGDESFTSMPKLVYDEQQAEQSTPSV